MGKYEFNGSSSQWQYNNMTEGPSSAERNALAGIQKMITALPDDHQAAGDTPSTLQEEGRPASSVGSGSSSLMGDKNVFRLRGHLSRLRHERARPSQDPLAGTALRIDALEPADDNNIEGPSAEDSVATGGLDPNDAAVSAGSLVEELTHRVTILEKEKQQLATEVQELRVQQCIAESETQQLHLQLQKYEGEGTTATTRLELEEELGSLRITHDVMATRLENFQQQLGDARNDMSD